MMSTSYSQQNDSLAGGRGAKRSKTVTFFNGMMPRHKHK
jgi:hypothetical protein